MEKKTEVVFIPLPRRGHMVSTMELAKRLARTHHRHLSITVLLMHWDIPGSKPSSPASYYADSGTGVRYIDLPYIDFPIKNDDHHPPGVLVSLFLDAHRTHVKEAITSLQSSSSQTAPQVAALIIDLFSTTLIDVGKELGIPTYVYFASGAALLSLMLYLPTLEKEIKGDFRDYEGMIEVPGFEPLPPVLMPSPVIKRHDGFMWFVYHARRFREVTGLIINTFAELEHTLLDVIRSGMCLPDPHTTPPIYPVGPLLGLDETNSQPESAKLLGWLDQQHHSSVLFLCFGSMGTLSTRQVQETALALDRSGHRFLWCLRSRSTQPFGLPIDPDLDQVLPPGFLDRTRGRGVVWPSWAPQLAILGHKAVRGFVSHCGWNSCLESIWFGVPILAWPLYAEQKLNAFQMVREYGLAVELKLDSEEGEGWVSADELERGVRCLMEDSEIGKRVRNKAKEMAELSRKAVQEGGSSFSSLVSLAEQFLCSATSN